MKGWIFKIICCTLLLTSCLKNVKKSINVSIKAQLIQPQYWIPELFKQYQFPLYFEDSLIKKYKIHRIEVNTYFEKYAHLDTNKKKLNQPQQRRIFHFNKQYQLAGIEIENYEDERLIGREVITYHEKEYNKQSYSPNINYNKTSFKKDSLRTTKLNRKTNQLQDSKHEVYSFSDNKNKIFVIKNKENLNPIIVDTLLMPSPEDLIVYPSINKPRKIYSVTNKILENPIFEFHYFHGICTYVSAKRGAEIKKRMFSFNRDGYTNGYTDSVFLDNQFIREYIQHFSLDRFQRPILIYRNTDEKMLKEVIELKYFVK